MTAWWQERVRAAEQARVRSGAQWGGCSLRSASRAARWWLRRARKVLLWLAWAFVTRKVKVVVGGIAAAALIVVVALVTALVVVAALLA